MSLRIGDEAPNFTADTTQGRIDFHQWIGDGWAILFSHPKDFTPVCTTELGYMAKLQPEFAKRNCKVIGLSIDPVTTTSGGPRTSRRRRAPAPNYPIIGDADLNVAKLYDMIHPNATGGKRTAADNATVRSVFVVGPDKKIKLTLTYPMSTGRNFDEVLRVLDSIQLTARHKVATPVNWKPGEDVIIPTSVSDDDAKKKYPRGLEDAPALPADRARSRSRGRRRAHGGGRLPSLPCVAQPPLEVPPLRVERHERERALVRGGRFRAAAQAPQEIGPGRGQQVVAPSSPVSSSAP